jgi:rubrerythrin
MAGGKAFNERAAVRVRRESTAVAAGWRREQRALPARFDLRCADCGYGAVARRPLRCPMCGGEVWDFADWRPFRQ